jgi:hypothetical protein
MDLVGTMKAVYVDASTRGMCEQKNFESHYFNMEFFEFLFRDQKRVGG